MDTGGGADTPAVPAVTTVVAATSEGDATWLAGPGPLAPPAATPSSEVDAGGGATTVRSPPGDATDEVSTPLSDSVNASSEGNIAARRFAASLAALTASC